MHFIIAYESGINLSPILGLPPTELFCISISKTPCIMYNRYFTNEKM
jgi:hypothetical protein